MSVQPKITFKRVFVRYFSEEISDIEILKGGHYTVFCLQTKLYIYSRNGRDLYDIIPCCNPTIYSAISKSLSDTAVVATLFSSGSNASDYKEDSVQIKDYSYQELMGSFKSSKQQLYSRVEDFRITKPFGHGYEIGGLSLDNEGHRLAVVSKDACSIYLYIVYGQGLDEETRQKSISTSSKKTVTPKKGESVDNGADSSPSREAEREPFVIKDPIQRFTRGQTACDKIFKPI
jgi:hypothetical protein